MSDSKKGILSDAYIAWCACGELAKNARPECGPCANKVRIKELRALVEKQGRALEAIKKWEFALDGRKFDGNHKEVLRTIIYNLVVPALSTQEPTAAQASGWGECSHGKPISGDCKECDMNHLDDEGFDSDRGASG